MIYFETEVRLKDGRLMFVTGFYEIDLACDCEPNNFHPHISKLVIDSAVEVIDLLDAEVHNPNIDVSAKAEIEELITEELYEEFKESA